MFTGIISRLGKIENITHPNDWELSVKVENNKILLILDTAC